MEMFFFKLSFLKLLGNINEILSQNSQDFFINLIAKEDCRPNGGVAYYMYFTIFFLNTNIIIKQIILFYYLIIIWF